MNALQRIAVRWCVCGGDTRGWGWRVMKGKRPGLEWRKNPLDRVVLTVQEDLIVGVSF